MDIRNVCIIAHVDHGKTTLVDFLLRQAGTFKSHEILTDRVMDSGDLEREPGITILAKNTSVRVGSTKINKVDRPGCKGGQGIHEVIDQVFDLFVELGASDEQADFPIVYACGRAGWCTLRYDQLPALLSGEAQGNLQPLFDLILSTVPAPK